MRERSRLVEILEKSPGIGTPNSDTGAISTKSRTKNHPSVEILRFLIYNKLHYEL